MRRVRESSQMLWRALSTSCSLVAQELRSLGEVPLRTRNRRLAPRPPEISRRIVSRKLADCPQEYARHLRATAADGSGHRLPNDDAMSAMFDKSFLAPVCS